MTRWLALFALAACNRTFGLDQTALAPPDASPVCPAIGTTPEYLPTVLRAIHQECNAYTSSRDANLAMASCSGTFDFMYCTEVLDIWAGPSDGPLAKIALPPPPRGELMTDVPVLAPEGNEAFVNMFAPTGPLVFTAYARDPDGTWRFESYPAVPVAGEPSTPSRGPARHMMMLAALALHELVEDGSGAWNDVATYTTSDLHQIASRSVYLSPDGLRLIYSAIRPGENQIATFYADRPSIDARFGAPTELVGVPWTYDILFMEADCSKIYFSGLGYVLYVQER